MPSLAKPPFESLCLIPGYVTLSGLAAPNLAVLSPFPMAAVAFYLFIIAQAMYVFSTFGAHLANFISTGSFTGINLAEAASDTMSSIKDTGSKILGVDSDSIKGAKDARSGIDSTAKGVKNFGKLFKRAPRKNGTEVEIE